MLKPSHTVRALLAAVALATASGGALAQNFMKDKAEVEKLRAQFQLENNPPVLTLQPVIGQRKSRPTEIRIGKDRVQTGYVNGSINDEARELRRFDGHRSPRACAGFADRDDGER